MEPLSSAPVTLLFGLLFVLAGPIKAMPTFQALTGGMDRRSRNILALKGAGFGALGIAIAVLMAGAMTAKYAVSSPAIGTAAGLLLTVVGLLQLIGVEQKSAPSGPIEPLTLAFPILLPPFAFGLILLFAISLPDNAKDLILLGVALMAMNALAMMVAEPVLKRTGMVPLRLLGAIFGILQLAFGIEVLFWGIGQGLRNVI